MDQETRNALYYFFAEAIEAKIVEAMETFHLSQEHRSEVQSLYMQACSDTSENTVDGLEDTAMRTSGVSSLTYMQSFRSFK